MLRSFRSTSFDVCSRRNDPCGDMVASRRHGGFVDSTMGAHHNIFNTVAAKIATADAWTIMGCQLIVVFGSRMHGVVVAWHCRIRRVRPEPFPRATRVEGGVNRRAPPDRERSAGPFEVTPQPLPFKTPHPTIPAGGRASGFQRTTMRPSWAEMRCRGGRKWLRSKNQN